MRTDLRARSALADHVAGAALREEMLHWRRELVDRGLTPGIHGSMSVRVAACADSPEAVVITPRAVRHDLVQPQDMVVVGMDGTLLVGELLPSTWLPVHLAHYRRRPDVHAVVHTDSTYANVLGALGRPVEPVLVTMLRYARGVVPVLPFEPSTSAELGERSAEAMGDGVDAIVWAHGGLLAVGHSLQHACTVAVAVEQNARVLHQALLLGEPAVLHGTLDQVLHQVTPRA